MVVNRGIALPFEPQHVCSRQGFDELAKSLDRPADSPLDQKMSIFISDDRLADLGEFGYDVLEQVRLAFGLEEPRRLDWEIVDARGRVLRSSR